MILPYWR